MKAKYMDQKIIPFKICRGIFYLNFVMKMFYYTQEYNENIYCTTCVHTYKKKIETKDFASKEKKRRIKLYLCKRTVLTN